MRTNLEISDKTYLNQNWKNIFTASQDVNKQNCINPYKNIMAQSAYAGIKAL